MHKFKKPKPLTLALSLRERGLKAKAVLRNTTNQPLSLWGRVGLRVASSP